MVKAESPLPRDTCTSGLVCCPPKLFSPGSLSNSGLNPGLRLPRWRVRLRPASRQHPDSLMLRRRLCRRRLRSGNPRPLRKSRHRTRRHPPRTRHLRDAAQIPPKNRFRQLSRLNWRPILRLPARPKCRLNHPLLLLPHRRSSQACRLLRSKHFLGRSRPACTAMRSTSLRLPRRSTQVRRNLMARQPRPLLKERHSRRMDGL